VNAHWVLVDNAKKQRPGSLYECLAANILAAFKLEAYLNHLGPLILADWDEKRGWHFKLERIRKHLGVKPHDPRFQRLDEIFTLRNQVAHGKTTKQVTEGIEIGDTEELRRRRPLAFWEERCTPEFSELAWRHTQAIIKWLHRAAGRDPQELRRPGASYSIHYVDTTDG
jgi:hypothetical protein